MKPVGEVGSLVFVHSVVAVILENGALGRFDQSPSGHDKFVRYSRYDSRKSFFFLKIIFTFNLAQQGTKMVAEIEKVLKIFEKNMRSSPL